MRRTIVVVIANHHLLRLAVLAHLAPKVLVEGVEVILQLARVHLVLGVVGRVLVQVRQEDGLGVGGFDVLAAAAVAVAAGADLVVEGAVDFVLLRAEDGGEVAGRTLAWGVFGVGEGGKVMMGGGKERGSLGHFGDVVGIGRFVVVSGGEVEEIGMFSVEGWTLKFATC